MSGGKNYAKRYAQYKPDATNFGKYVDSRADLKTAWKRIQDDPDHADSQYWIKRGATSKEAFGRAHAAEDSALLGGTYMGATDYDVGTEAWEGLFDDGKTSYEQFLIDSNKNSNRDNLTGGTTGGVTSDIIAQDAYAAPAYQDFSEYSSLLDGNEGLLYQPHTAEYQSKFGTDMYNYNPVQLDPWTARTVDWSPSLLDASDYLTNEEKAAKIKAAQKQEMGDHQFEDTGPGVPWQNTFLAPLGYKLGWNYAGPGMTNISSKWQDMGDAEDDMINAQMMADANMGNVQATMDEVLAAGGYETSENDDYD